MVGGLLLSVFPWSSIFWVNVPIAVVTLVISKVAVAESREPVPRPFDTGGVALSASGLLLLTFGFVDSSDAGWRSPVVAACVAAGVAVVVIFFVWEHRTAFPMVPPALLRTPSFGRACAVYLLAYLAFSGFIYYVTLFFQNVDGWSALRTGLSWLFFCIPYFAVAQLGRWVERRLSAASAVGWGCLIAAAGMLGMSQLKHGDAVCLAGRLLRPGGGGLRPDGPRGFGCGDGRGAGGIIGDRVRPVQRLPPDRHRDGAGHSGSIGTSVILADWHRQAGSFPSAEQRRAAHVGADVAGGQVHAAAAHLSEHALDAAVASFLRGFELALVLAGAILAAGAVVGFWGLRHLQSPVLQQRQKTDVSTSG